MKSSNSYFVIFPKASLQWLVLFISIWLSGCKNYGPIGTPDFDPSFSRTLQKNEQLLFTTRAELLKGTYMEEEHELFQSYRGVLLLTNERMLFAEWNVQQRRYKPTVWTGYPDIAKVKKHNNILLQYIAIITTDGSKFTYMLGTNNVDAAYDILLEQIQKTHKAQMPAGPIF